jgi:hypothetical protein
MFIKYKYNFTKTSLQELTRVNPLFPNVTKLHIDVCSDCSLNSMKFLPSLINISQLIQVKLESFYFNKSNKNFLFNMINILEHSCNLTSLIIHSRICKYELYPYLNIICSTIPCQIKHLQIPINRLDQIQFILERCQHLSVIQFETTRLKFSEEVIEWFTKHTISSAFERHNGCDIIWIGKKLEEVNVNYKRIKFDS